MNFPLNSLENARSWLVSCRFEANGSACEGVIGRHSHNSYRHRGLLRVLLEGREGAGESGAAQRTHWATADGVGFTSASSSSSLGTQKLVSHLRNKAHVTSKRRPVVCEASRQAKAYLAK
jgi:hypothetical protein